MIKIFNNRNIKLFVAAIGLAMFATACKKSLEIAPQDKLEKKQVYNTLADADAAVMGIYGQFATLGEQYVLLNELRADLMDVTANADPYLQQLSNHDATVNNPYIDPTNFYKIIFNCNDAIANFKIMGKEGKLKEDEFQQRYSDVVALRSFLYLQLAIHFGQVPYITDPVISVDDLKAIENFPKITFDVMIDSLLAATTNLPYKESYAYPTASSLNFSTDGVNTRKIFINKPELIGELQLWKGNYYEAAKAFKKVLDTEDNNSDVNYQVEGYRIGWQYNVISFTKSQTASSLVNSTSDGWRAMFAQPNTSRNWIYEWTWGIPYNNSFAPGNPFIELMGGPEKGGKYLVKPSQKVIDLWNAQTLTNGVPGDARGTLSYKVTSETDPNPIITKFTDGVTTLSVINKGGSWNIWRAAGVHLKFAEAANRDGQGKVAYALLNNGLLNTFYDGTYSGADQSGTTKVPANFDEANSAITPYPEGSPYYFDARDFAIGRGLYWYRNQGIRGRAMEPRLELPGITYRDPYERRISSFNVDQSLLEDKIIEEAAMELAFEGSRWGDLMRIARRRNNPAFLADKIYDKLMKAGNPKAAEVRSKLMDPNNWYLPFKIK
ncbi:hypothetical protein BCY91_11370 [Pelobium manganitolerans]|uniref:RagB/SusD domain-containing protein n=1 Tax=Pelobium manganitolerans TaxID=1842495 RepID=A0A419S2B5_9SPHI|nr:RagB/SusD family nutrient uptake outer membrane protein [Pelobium manganitolerans]RKD12837.1 hypothetical protein BCY91_11370 [Pelobium manganitolerans]